MPEMKYNPDIHIQLIGCMARYGATDIEISQELGISRSTLSEWKKKYIEISDTLKENKNIADSYVENSLYKRANGYEYEETETIEIKDKDGNVIKTKNKKTKKQIAPDVTAQIFWLKNRQKERWRDVKEYHATYAPGTRKQLKEALKHITDEDYNHALEQAGLNDIH